MGYPSGRSHPDGRLAILRSMGYWGMTIPVSLLSFFLYFILYVCVTDPRQIVQYTVHAGMGVGGKRNKREYIK